MPCPYLAQVTMVYCQASPQRKLIPSDRVSTASSCESETFGSCPLYRETMRRALHVIEEHDHELEESCPQSPPSKKGDLS